MPHFDFIEIGTSDFDSLAESASEHEVGLSIEPVPFYLSRLPERPNVRKINVAISDKDGEAQLFYVHPDDIAEHGLDYWLRGCNALGASHPTVRSQLEPRGLMHLERTMTVPVWSFETLVEKEQVQSVERIKIDTEGHDVTILHSIAEAICKGQIPAVATIQFESNVLSSPSEVARVVRVFRHLGYVFEQRVNDGFLTYQQPKPIYERDIINSLPELFHRGPSSLYNYVGSLPTLQARQPNARIPRSLHMVWLGCTPPNYAFANVEIWQRLLGKEWRVRLWTDADLETFSPEVRTLIERSSIGAQKADILRYHIVHNEGGFYVDTDCEPVQSLEALLQRFPWSTAMGCHERAFDPNFPYLSSGFFGAIPDHPWLKAASRIAAASDLSSKDVHLETGPRCFGLAALESPDPILLLPTSYAYPTGDPNAPLHYFYQTSFMVHRWAGSWVQK